MKPPRSSLRLGKAFDENVASLDAALREFLKTGDAANTQSLRRAIRRFRVSHSVLPKGSRNDRRVRRYVDAVRGVSKATGRVRDLDTITAWASEATEGRDRRAIASDLTKLRSASLRNATSLARELAAMNAPSVDPEDLSDAKTERRVKKVERRIVRRVDKEFEEFLSNQEVGVMHALRKDSKRLRHLLELSQREGLDQLLSRLRSIQDDLGAIRDHDLEIDYLRSRARLTSNRSLIREEIAKRHAKLEEFMTKNRGRGRLVDVPSKGALRG